MENLLKELSTTSMNNNQLERLQNTHIIRQQEWVKSRRDDITDGNPNKRRRFNQRVNEDLDDSSDTAGPLQTAVETSSVKSQFSDSVHPDTQSTS